MRPLILDIATAIGLLVMAGTVLVALLLVAGMCVDAWQQRRRMYVPREWVAEEGRRDCRRRPARREDR